MIQRCTLCGKKIMEFTDETLCFRFQKMCLDCFSIKHTNVITAFFGGYLKEYLEQKYKQNRYQRKRSISTGKEERR